MILQSNEQNLLVRVTVVATDTDNGLSTQSLLFLNFQLDHLYNQFLQKDELQIELIAENPISKKITNEDFNKLTGSTLIDQQEYFMIKQNTEPNKVIANLKARFDGNEIESLPLRLTITQIPGDNDNLDPSVFFHYENTNKTIKVIREIRPDMVNTTIRFRLMDIRGLSNQDESFKKFDIR